MSYTNRRKREGVLKIGGGSGMGLEEHAHTIFFIVTNNVFDQVLKLNFLIG